jgi:catechol 2,3-dioxygenase-like lactoylglutathione lyase family enzyme
MPSVPSLHHIALACRDPHATHRFYEGLLGFPLVYAEMDEGSDGGWLKHLFFDLGDGSCLAFFDLHGMGEPQGEGPEGYDTAISTGLGLPFWVNHVAIRADATRVADVRARLRQAGVKVEMELDHGWCHSLYVTDPNGILVELTVDTPGFQPDPEEARRILSAPAPGGLGAPGTTGTTGTAGTAGTAGSAGTATATGGGAGDDRQGGAG